MRQDPQDWKVPNFAIAMKWFETHPKKGTTGYTSKDKLEAPFIVPPVGDGTRQYARYHLRHSNRANGGREAQPARQDHLELLYREYQQVYRDSKRLVTLPPEVQWAFGLSIREHLLLILLWIRRAEDPLTGKRILSGSNYYVTVLMLRLCGQRSGKWLDAAVGLAKKRLIVDWHFTVNPDDTRFRLCDWSFSDDVRQRLLDNFVPTWAYESKPETSSHDEHLHQSTETCARAPAPEHESACAGTPRPASEHGQPAPEQHRLTDLHDVTDLPDPNGGPPLADEPERSPAVQGFSKDMTSSSVLLPSNEDASTVGIHDTQSSNVLQSTSLESLRDDTFLLPLDFKIPPETEPMRSSPSTVITEVVSAIHERCTHVAAKRVAEMEDGSQREAPGVPSKRGIRKFVEKHASDILRLLNDDQVRRSALDKIDGHWQYVAKDYAERLPYWALRCAEAVGAARDDARQALLQRRTEDVAMASHLRENSLATFSDLVRIEDGAEEPNCRRIQWEGVDLRSAWARRSPIVVAAWTATGRSSEMPNCTPPVAELAQRIIDANGHAVEDMKRRKREIDEEWDRRLQEKTRQDQEYVRTWLPETRLEELWENPNLRAHLMESARKAERKHAQDEDAAKRRAAQSTGEKSRSSATRTKIMNRIMGVTREPHTRSGEGAGVSCE